jgi:hypothetical protein
MKPFNPVRSRKSGLSNAHGDGGRTQRLKTGSESSAEKQYRRRAEPPPLRYGAPLTESLEIP